VLTAGPGGSGVMIGPGWECGDDRTWVGVC